MKVIALFESTRAVIKSERLCKANNIHCKVIPVPRHLSAGCGMALELNESDTEQFALILKNEAIDVRFENQ
jgi:hypothetical protein